MCQIHSEEIKQLQQNNTVWTKSKNSTQREQLQLQLL